LAVILEKGENLGRRQEQSNGDRVSQQRGSLEHLPLAMLHEAENEIEHQDNRDVYHRWGMSSQDHESKGDSEAGPGAKSRSGNCTPLSIPE
jgi:hypothetical protein